MKKEGVPCMNLYNGTDNDINIIDLSAVKFNNNVNNCTLLREDNYIVKVIKQDQPLKVHENSINKSIGSYDDIEIFMPNLALVNKLDVPADLEKDHVVIVSQYYANVAATLNHGILPYLYTTYGKVKDKNNRIVGCLGLQKVHLAYPSNKIESINTPEYLINRLSYCIKNRRSNPSEVVLALRILLSNYEEIVKVIDKEIVNEELRKALLYFEDNDLKIGLTENKLLEKYLVYSV